VLELRFKLGHDRDIGASKAVDALPVVAHHAYRCPIASALEECLQQTNLRSRRVLEFVDHDHRVRTSESAFLYMVCRHQQHVVDVRRQHLWRRFEVVN